MLQTSFCISVGTGRIERTQMAGSHVIVECRAEPFRKDHKTIVATSVPLVAFSL